MQSKNKSTYFGYIYYLFRLGKGCDFDTNTYIILYMSLRSWQCCFEWHQFTMYFTFLGKGRSWNNNYIALPDAERGSFHISSKNSHKLPTLFIIACVLPRDRQSFWDHSILSAWSHLNPNVWSIACRKIITPLIMVKFIVACLGILGNKIFIHMRTRDLKDKT